MRTLTVVLAAVALALLPAMPAAASCRPPVSVAENGATATAVVHGTVTSVSGGALTVRIDRVFKGQVGASARVFVGPGRAGTAATSVDYLANAGSDHVLYLIRGSDGQLETNACIGSHPGLATADELAYFGAGIAPAAGSSPDTVAGPAVAIPFLEISPVWSAILLASAAGVAVLVLWRRRLRSHGP